MSGSVQVGAKRSPAISAHTTGSTIERILVTLDPGIRIAGPAVFRGKKLKAAALIKNPIKAGNGVAACTGMAAELYVWVAHQVFMLEGHTGVDEFIAEWPRVYATRIRQGKTKEDPNDLPPLSGVVCALAILLSGANREHVAPSDWKGQVPADVMTARILAALDRDEVEILARSILQREDPILYTDRIKALLKHPTAHNTIDGVGIGLHRLGRLKAKRTIVR